MANLIIKGLTIEEAKVFAEFLEMKGDQFADQWFEDACEDGRINSNGIRVNPEHIEIVGEDVIITPKVYPREEE